MSQMNTPTRIAITRLFPVLVIALTLLLSSTAYAAAPGVQGTNFALTAAPAFISQPDGGVIYSWGYACSGGGTAAPAGIAPTIGSACGGVMQVPGPTLIVTEGQTVTVTLTNNLPAAAGNTSILFSGFQVTTGGTGVAGLLTREAAHAGTVTYTFPTTGKAGTHAYYSGTQGDLQVEMGLYGAIIVLPLGGGNAACNAVSSTLPDGQPDYRLASSAYDHAATCYDREYLFQFSEIDPKIHRQAEEQADLACTIPSGCLQVATEPYHPAYFMINGRSMPDDMDPNYAPQYPHQPYNGNPHMHPGEQVLLRVIGTGRWQHPFHEHGNHVRILGRDGNLILSSTDATRLAGPLLFTTTTTPGLAMDGIFYWTGKGLNWDVYGHKPGDGSTCTADANGYNTSSPSAPNYYEWCADHNKPLETHPFGTVGSGGPVTLPDPNILADGPWYGGSPYLGPDATGKAVSPSPIPPSGTVANDPGSEAGFAFMWHSHNEREITTNNIFPGGMMMMMLVDPQAYTINESN
jgi:FtsP/CotA-like multicopper oxidase with cupredoxin domain